MSSGDGEPLARAPPRRAAARLRSTATTTTPVGRSASPRERQVVDAQLPLGTLDGALERRLAASPGRARSPTARRRDVRRGSTRACVRRAAPASSRPVRAISALTCDAAQAAGRRWPTPATCDFSSPSTIRASTLLTPKIPSSASISEYRMVGVQRACDEKRAPARVSPATRCRGGATTEASRDRRGRARRPARCSSRPPCAATMWRTTARASAGDSRRGRAPSAARSCAPATSSASFDSVTTAVDHAHPRDKRGLVGERVGEQRDEDVHEARVDAVDPDGLGRVDGDRRRRRRPAAPSPRRRAPRRADRAAACDAARRAHDRGRRSTTRAAGGARWRCTSARQRAMRRDA